jgi:hypothetical protein
LTNGESQAIANTASVFAKLDFEALNLFGMINHHSK